MKLQAKVTNDNGNSEQALIINDELIRQPNTYALELAYKRVGDKSIEELVENLYENLFVSIQSPALDFPGQYYIGKAAIDKGTTKQNMNAGKEYKADSAIPVVNTIGNIAAWAVKTSFNKKGKLVKDLEVTVDMTTALPVTEYKLGSKHNKEFENKFMEGTHTAVVFLGEEKVNVKINFDFVKVLPEGTAVLFYLNHLSKNHEVLQDFAKKYDIKPIDGKYFQDKRLLHVDIGDGTTELPITRHMAFDEDKAEGLNMGIAHAIVQAMNLFTSQETGYAGLNRQKFSEYLKDAENHSYEAPKAHSYMQIALQPVISEIINKIKEQLDKAYNEIDVVVVYGGGSILMKDLMEPLLEKELGRRKGGQIKLFWVPKAYAPLMNVEGMDAFMKLGMFDRVKEAVLTSN
ncbi:ParM/StbA family protein [Priestia koreensis]|uniref:ParM/StbA family protein n=1 Tax=Priestia koreensis TaxID=284581 RepID=UPI003016E0BC